MFKTFPGFLKYYNITSEHKAYKLHLTKFSLLLNVFVANNSWIKFIANKKYSKSVLAYVDANVLKRMKIITKLINSHVLHWYRIQLMLTHSQPCTHHLTLLRTYLNYCSHKNTRWQEEKSLHLPSSEYRCMNEDGGLNPYFTEYITSIDTKYSIFGHYEKYSHWDK